MVNPLIMWSVTMEISLKDQHGKSSQVAILISIDQIDSYISMENSYQCRTRTRFSYMKGSSAVIWINSEPFSKALGNSITKYQYRTRTSFLQMKVFLIQSVLCKKFHIQSFGNLVMTLLKVNRNIIVLLVDLGMQNIVLLSN